MTENTATGRLELAAFDAPDCHVVADFYQSLTGWERVRDVDDWVTLQTPDGQQVGFQQVPDHRPSTWPSQERPQHFHLDLLVDDHEAAAAAAAELGARRVGEGESWLTLLDPAGHPFDLCRREGQEGYGLFAVTVDTDRASALARFWAGLLGMEVTYEGPEGALVAGEVDGVAKSLMFQQVADYSPPSWGDPDRPQQAHLDVLVDDLGASRDHALALGATLLGSGGESYLGMVDPSGHPFDITTG
jgi:catechol 2,3-dioxygenase-like lactoylglutathione lyase family enzyme